ncbi:MAG: class I SAM-dependent methyltransferase [Solirubrobacteraceae bacterium MAG38_C4-C5]|nr:class I SAM-dependent methyltransferase [Candidatus Siliceabacter maunaloa]
MLAHGMHAEGSTVAKRIAALGYDYGAQAKERSAGCNLCGAHGHSDAVAEQDRYGYPATCVVCRRCGLAYLSPRLSATGYTHFYAGVYRPLVSAYHGRRIDAESVQLEQRGYAARLATFLRPLLPFPPRTILDVGGSTGVVAGVLAARLDAHATVLDPAPDELAVAAAAGMETFAGLAEDFDPGERSWDLVLLCQTIDHLLDVGATLAALRRMTAAGGRAFVDILDLDLVLRREGSIERAVKVDHPFYLTRSTAAAFFALSGYMIVAECLSDDGHRGFVLAPAPCAEPDWPALGAGAEEFLDRLWALCRRS